ncbi:MAG: MIP family channel protein [Chloroflexota bacterium]|nr:MIP family channel protein [Chloroflexota bacterium]
MTVSLPRRAGAEAIGAYALVTAGCGAIVVNSQTGALGHVGVALTFGLVIMVMITATGHLSGAHFNPAVTFAFALARHFPWRDLPAYIAAQLVGAIGGALTLRALFGDVAALGATVPSATATRSFGLEVLLTAVLMFVITSVATDTRAVGQLTAVAIGATIALNALWGGPVSGASMNPARSFGPALASGVWDDHWVYWLGPLIGASFGGLLYGGLRATAQGAEPASDAPVARRTQRRVGAREG